MKMNNSINMLSYSYLQELIRINSPPPALHPLPQEYSVDIH